MEVWTVIGPILIAKGRDGLAGRTLPIDWKIRDKYPRSKFFTHTSVTFSHFLMGPVLAALPQVQILAMTLTP